MSLTLLLDLDNTLLENEMSQFLPAYFDGFAKCMAEYVDPENVLQPLLSATDRMIKNNNPDRTLKEIFDEYFYPAIGVPYEEIQATFKAFFVQEYPKLKVLTDSNPEAIALVENALSRGYRLVIATNPLFPEIAIRQRLDWAGLSPEKYPFSLITSYENSHFAKPNPAYYAEIIGKFAWPKESVIMVGDDPYNDIEATNQLGIPNFWVRPSHSTISNEEFTQLPERVINSIQPPNSSGRLSEVLPWIDNSNLDDLMADYNSPSAILAVLRSTPAVILCKISSIPEEKWKIRFSETNWSLTEIICHLRDVEEKVHLTRLKTVLENKNPFLPGEDTDSWNEEYQYISQNGNESLQKFVEKRKQTLSILESLNLEDWLRPARHAIFGPTDLQELCHIITGHDQLHLKQIFSLIDTLSFRNDTNRGEKSLTSQFE